MSLVGEWKFRNKVIFDNNPSAEATHGIGEFGVTPPITQPGAIADVLTGGSATAAANAIAINSILAVLRTKGTIAT